MSEYLNVTIRDEQGHHTVDNLENMKNAFMAKMKKQLDEVLEAADNEKGYQLKDKNLASVQAYKKDRGKIKKYIIEALTASMSVNMLNELIETNYLTLDSPMKSKDIIGIKREGGGKWGKFIEEGLLGNFFDNKMTADISEIDTEVKVHTGSRITTQVGNITLYGEKRIADLHDAAVIAALYKMSIKMNNFILFSIEPEYTENGVRGKFEDIMLYMGLILKKLYDLLYAETVKRGGKYVQIVEGKWANGSKKITVEIAVAKLADVYTIGQMYLSELNLLDLVHSDDVFRKGFFKTIRDIKFTFQGTTSPTFNLNIK